MIKLHVNFICINEWFFFVHINIKILFQNKFLILKKNVNTNVYVQYTCNLLFLCISLQHIK
jgi:hypothetical protein